MSNRARGIVSVIALLLIGAAAGVTADRVLHRRPVHVMLAQFPGTPAERAQSLKQHLGLSDEQTRQVEDVMERRQKDLDESWLKARKQLHATLDSVVTDISAVLTPEQAARFRRFVEERHGVRLK